MPGSPGPLRDLLAFGIAGAAGTAGAAGAVRAWGTPVAARDAAARGVLGTVP